ncbi:MAG TPA: hypothetical protein VGS19_32665 [Streptosporangiaceae bacterium]|nr:hypothetical protein [Streptosporangiaceae bacterium]
MTRHLGTYRRGLVTSAAVAGCVLALAVPALAATPASTPVPRGYVVMSASWPTPKSGLVLFGKGYDAGGTPYLFQTTNSGLTWHRLAIPTVMADGSVYAGDGVIVAAKWNLTRLAVTRDQGRHWSMLQLRGIPAGTTAMANRITIADKHIYALVQLHTRAGPGPTVVYSGTVSCDVLHPVPGQSIPGTAGLPYGDITARGTTVQTVLGNMTTTEHYWYSRDGVHFTSAPKPCPVTKRAFPVRTFGAMVVALCADPPATVGPGITDMRVWAAPRLGGVFRVAGPSHNLSDEQDFTAVSGHDMTMTDVFQLLGTSDGATTWKPEESEPAGASWSGLAFPTATTGFVVADTVNTSLHNVGILFRTTDGGRTWKPVPLP